MGYQKVLVPVSGKDLLGRAARALEQALQIVRKDGEICFLHCVDEKSYLITGNEHRNLVMEDAGEAEKLFAPLPERVINAGITYSAHILEGPPATLIPRFAEEGKFNAIVMYSSGHDDLGKLIGKLVVGGVTERVLHAINIPLLIC